VAEQAYEHILSLPIFSRMGDRDATDVIRAVEKVVGAYAT
jgi:dTDP-4-amino-4,6-dideoxygalactose transaminase